MNYINSEYFKPLLQQFCEKTKVNYETGYDQGPFIPYVMEKYRTAPLKIFYIGRDTYWWIPQEELFACYQRNNLDEYLDKNKNGVTVDSMISGWGNSAGAFWPFVERLHLLIRTGKYYQDLTNLTTEEHNILEEIGYGNLYSIEIPSTLAKRWEGWQFPSEEDKKKYESIQESGKIFEGFQQIIDAYHPDLMIVLSWTEKEDELIDLDYQCQCQPDLYEENYKSIFLSKTTNPPIIWSLHPSRFRFLGTNSEEMAYYLRDAYLKIRELYSS